jgi:3-deoxy-D-manno-octulosonic acid kinase
MAQQAGARFEERRRGAQVLRVASDFAAAVEAASLPAAGSLAARDAGDARGRAGTAVIALPGRPERIHLRPVRHGGWVGGLLRGALWGLGRPTRELEVTARLAAAGAPVPHPVLVAGARLAGPLWTAVVGTVHEEGSADGVAFLASHPDRHRLLRAAEAAGRAVRRFHDAGGRHADLHIKNLLLCEDGRGARALVIDLDRARATAPPDPRRRMRELMRLYRSLIKRGLLAQVGPRGCARFFAAYVDGDRTLRRALLVHLPCERRRVALHALGYRLGRAGPPGAARGGGAEAG